MTKTRLIAARATELRFEAYTRAQAPLLVCPLFALLGALPWLSGELDLVRVVVSISFLAGSVALAVRYRPRRESVLLRPESRELVTTKEKLEIATPARFTLDLCHDDTEAPRGWYVAFIELASGKRSAVLVGEEPDAVLRDLRRVLEHVPGQVECRWGLPAGAQPWVFEPVCGESAPDREPAVVLVHERIAPLALLRVIAVATALILLDLTVLVTSQQKRLPHVHPLSVVLPVAMGSFLVALTVVLATRRARLSAGKWIQSDVGAARSERVRGVYVVGPAGARGRHILIDTSDGPLSVWVPKGVASAKARQISRAVEQRSRGGLANLGSITSAPHTSPGA